MNMIFRLLALTAVVCIPNWQQLFSQNNSSPISDAELSVKALLDQFAGADDLMGDERHSREKLIAMGPEVIPPLIRLFRESEDDNYRSTIVNVMLSVDGARQQTISFINEELAQPQSKWLGKKWIFASLIRVHDLDSQAGVRLAVRVLEHDERSIQLAALRVLETHGSQTDLASVEGFLRKRRAMPYAGSGPDGVALAAQEAIDAIRLRTGTVEKSAVPGGESAVTEAKVLVSPPTVGPAMPPGAEVAPLGRSSKWLWTVAYGILAISVLVILRCKTKK